MLQLDQFFLIWKKNEFADKKSGDNGVHLYNLFVNMLMKLKHEWYFWYFRYFCSVLILLPMLPFPRL